MSEPQDASGYLKRPFRLAHVLWAVLGVASTAILISFGGEGHPPATALLPVVWVVWALGHGALWMVRRLASKGHSRALGAGGGTARWPLGLALALFGTGATTAIGFFPVSMTFFEPREGRFLEPLWLIMTAVWLLHGVCFVGLLLRRAWSRLFGALLCFGWVALLLAQIVDSLVHGLPIRLGELIIALILITIGVLFGVHLATSRHMRDFLGIASR